jgi:hypothetical protein
MDAAEMIFVDRIDVAAEALRNPDEIGRMLRGRRKEKSEP